MDLSGAIPVISEVLQQACSQDINCLQPAENQLKQWETQPGFYTVLAAILNDFSRDMNTRWLAVLYFKNGIDRYWRRNAPNSICEEEKVSLKSVLLSNFMEPVNQIAVQRAILIAKIARLDCPRFWTELIPTLISQIKSGHPPLVQQRALLTFYHVIKALASRRFEPERRVFEELTVATFEFLLSMWETSNLRCMQQLEAHHSEACSTELDHMILLLKVLRRLVTFGFRDPSKHSVVDEFMPRVFRHLDQFLQSKPVMQQIGAELLPKREKILLLLCKVLLEVQEHHPEYYVRFLQVSLELITRCNFTDHVRDLLFEQFVIHLFNLLRNILRCESYKITKKNEAANDPVVHAANAVRTSFFSQSTVAELCRQLVLRYFILTKDELECWNNDPENFMTDESGDTWKFNLRQCTEFVFVTLVKEFRDLAVPVIMELVRENETLLQTDDDLSAILKKDAVYCAVGEAAFELYDHVNFDLWFTEKLQYELANKGTNFRIIRRRIVWLLGCWVGVKLSSDLRPRVYECLVPALQRDEDLVIRIEVALTLKSCIDDFDFSVEQFRPFLAVIFGQLFQLLQDVSESETKMTVLHVMSFIIERMQTSIKCHTDALVQYLPLLWAESADHNLLRCAIISTLTTLVQGFGNECVSIYSFLLPVIHLSTDVSNPQHIYLYEDGLDLWLTVLHASPSITAELLDLYRNMSSLLELGTETLQLCLKVTESYVLLAPKEMMQTYGSMLAATLSNLLQDIRTEGVVLIYKIVELTLNIYPEGGAAVFHAMLRDVVQCTIEKEEAPMVISIHLALLSRLVLQSPNFFWSFVDDMANSIGRSRSELMSVLLRHWMDKMDNVLQMERKKLCCLALASLLTSDLDSVLEHFAGIINICVESLHAVWRSDSGSGIALDSLLMSSNLESVGSSDEETEHDRRKHQASLQDPVHCVDVVEFVSKQLSDLRSRRGQANFDGLMENVDCEITQQLKHFIR